MQDIPDASEVLTIGHSNHAIGRFVDILHLHRVTMVLDVRSVPYSRFHPQFNRENLIRGLKDFGLVYVYTGKELGARTEDRSCYENSRVQFRKLAKTESFRLGLQQVHRERQSHRIALMCAEREPLQCHRTILVSQELVAAGTPIAHIHGDGHLETHYDAMKRLLKLLGLPDQDLFHSESDLIERACAKQEERVAYVDKQAVHES